MVAAPAQALGTACNSRDVVVGALAKQYREAVVAIGVTNSGRLMEVFSSSDGATFSIVVTDSRGRSCLTIVGENFRQHTYKIEDPEA